MRCRLVVQKNGVANLPLEIRQLITDAPAVDVRLTCGSVEMSLVAAVSRWKHRCWVIFPPELRNLCAPRRELDVDVSPLASTFDNRALIPRSGIVQFDTKIRGRKGMVVSIPLVWFRGMRSAGWLRRVCVDVHADDGRSCQFARSLSVRSGGRTVTLALPRRLCGEFNTGDAVTVRLKAAVVSVPTTSKDSDKQFHDWKLWDNDRREAELDRLVTSYRLNGFPWNIVEGCIERDPIGGVRRSKICIEGDVVTRVGYAGQKTCLAVHKHRLHARYAGQPSIVEAFEDDKLLRRALRYQLDRGDPVSPKRLLRALRAIFRGPNNFSPSLARLLVDVYAPDGGVVFDPCSGYGGRLLGALASERNVRYIGADIEPLNVEANIELARVLGESCRVDQRLQAVEDAVQWPAADLAIVGPPYYDREDYGDVSRASLSNYPTYGSWSKGFLRTLVTRTLGSAPIAVFNVSAIRYGKSIFDIPSNLKSEVLRVGGKVIRELTWKTSSFAKSHSEQLIVVQR